MPNLVFPAWVPEAARQVLQENHTASQAGRSRALIERLATDERMSTVWTKLPSQPEEAPWHSAALPPEWRPLTHAHGALAYFALHYAQDEITNALIAPRRTRTPDDAAYACTMTPTLFNLRRAADCARELRDLAHKIHPMAVARWGKARDGDPRITPDQMLKNLDEAAHFYESVYAPAEDLLRGTPRIVKRRARNARRLAYTRAISSTVHRLYGRPCDEAVTALVEVVFDLPDGVPVETVRSLRRKRLTG